MQWTDEKTVQTVVGEEETNLAKYAAAGIVAGAVAGIMIMGVERK